MENPESRGIVTKELIRRRRPLLSYHICTIAVLVRIKVVGESD